MDIIIKLNNVSKDFKVLCHREGLKGSLLDLFSRDYKIIRAVNNVSMDIYQGEIVGYLGPNGAGKSTTIKMMTGVLEPTAGEILVNGLIPYKKRTQNAQQIGVVFGQRSQLWWALPVIESFKIIKDIYQVNDRDYKDMMNLYGAMVNMDEILHKPVRQMSLGQRTLCDILVAFLHNPKVVFLDEPTIGLDVSMKSKIRELIKVLNKEKETTVILTTHDMGDVDALCRKIVIIDKGTMIYNNDIRHLRSFFGSYRILKIRDKSHIDDVNEKIMDNIVHEISSDLNEQYPDTSISVSFNDDWVDILVNEEEIPLLSIFNYIQSKRMINDMKIEEISTESVIKKIYEGKLA